jgi:SHS family lactate transporter-like MFS transporter
MNALRFVRPPARLEGREIRVLALLSTVAFAQGWTGNVLVHTLAFTRVTFGLSDGGIADVEAVVRGVALLALFLSWWSDRHGRRGPLLAAFVMLPVANLVTAFMPTLQTFAAAQSVARVGTMALGALALVVLAEEVTPAVRGYASALFALSLSMGAGFGLLVSFVAETSPEAWRLLFGISALPLAVFPLLAAHLQESRLFKPPAKRPPLAAVLSRGAARHFWPMAGLSFAVSAFTGPGANFILPRMVNDLSWQQGGASLMLVATSTPAVILGLLAGGRISDLAGRRPTEVAAIFTGVGGGILLYFSDSGWLIGAGIFLAILGSSAFAPAFAAQRAELFPTEVRATATAWLVNAAIFGGLAGFLAGRFVIDSWGLPRTIGGLGLLLLAASALVALLPETRGTDLAGEPVAPQADRALSG